MSSNLQLASLRDLNPTTYGLATSGTVKVVLSVALGLVLIKAGKKLIIKLVKEKKQRERVAISLSKPKVVIFHQLPRAVKVPSISPFPLKLETFLRLAKIKYENEFEDYISPKGKIGYITLDGTDIGDSQLIIEHLNRVFNVDLNQHLTETERAVAHSFRVMTEDSLYWAFVLHRWVYDKERSVIKAMKWPFPWHFFAYRLVNFRIQKAVYFQGMGRHTKDEVTQMATKDIKALSIYLGSKRFLFGDKPTETDCAVFGMLCQLIYTFPKDNPIKKYVEVECNNLISYIAGIKQLVWPDWEHCLDNSSS